MIWTVGPERTLERVRHALVAAGRPSVPATFDDEWRQHLTPTWALERLASLD